MTGCHLGIELTRAQVQICTFWSGWKSDVRLEVRRRNECTRYHRGHPPRQAELRPMIVGEPWERIGVDITGRHPRSSNSYEYILTVIDQFQKWSEPYPIRDHRAVTVARVQVDQLFSRFGRNNFAVCCREVICTTMETSSHAKRTSSLTLG